MRLKILAVAIMGAAFTVPACAQAATQIYTATIPTAPVSYTYNFTLPSFNSALGTLQSVKFELTDSSTASVVIGNINNVWEAFTNATVSIPLTVTGPGGLNIADTITASVASGTVAPGLSFFPGVTGTHSADHTFTSPGDDLSAFETNPVVNLSYTAEADAGTYSGTAAPGVLFGGSADAGGTFDIIYTYTAVPEPATWAFLMLGVGGIGMAMRNRRKAGLAFAAA